MEKISSNNLSCVRCGFVDVRALQLDHVNGGGSRFLGNGRSPYTHYGQILKDEDIKGKYQILCANCNWIKRYENNECASERFERNIR